MIQPLTIIRGAGDIGTGVALRLWRAGFKVLCLDAAQPLVIRRTVSFANAIYEREMTVEECKAVHVESVAACAAVWMQDNIPLLVDPHATATRIAQPDVLIDCVLSKTNSAATQMTQATLVIGCGPGFTAGIDCHAVIETQRGHALGRVLWSGSAEPNTGRPGKIGGEDEKRVVRAPVAGVMTALHAIGDRVSLGEVLARIDQTPVYAAISGVVRGMFHDPMQVSAGLKIADLDPRGKPEACFTVSDKALAIGGGVLEAVMSRLDMSAWRIRPVTQAR